MTTTYPTARFALPYFLVRAEANSVSCPVFENGAEVTPSAGTITVKDASGNAVVDGVAVTVSSGTATYSILAAVIPSSSALSDRWLVLWDLTIGGESRHYRNPAHIVRAPLSPVITRDDLIRRHSDLASWSTPDADNLQRYVDTSFIEIERRLIEEGHRPGLILSSFAFGTTHTNLALHHAMLDGWQSMDGGGKYQELAEYYRAEYEAAWKRISFAVDTDGDNAIDSGETGQAAVSVVSLTAAPEYVSPYWSWGIR